MSADKEFCVPIRYTTYGWIKVKAPTLEAAKVAATDINENEGINYTDLKDAEIDVEVLTEKITPLNDKGG